MPVRSQSCERLWCCQVANSSFCVPTRAGRLLGRIRASGSLELIASALNKKVGAVSGKAVCRAPKLARRRRSHQRKEEPLKPYEPELEIPVPSREPKPEAD